jgi:hypothetical protein
VSSLTLAAAVAVDILHLVQVALVVAVRGTVLLALLAQLVRQILAAVVVAALITLEMAAQVVQELSSLVTLAHNVAQAARSHQAVATPFIHSHLAVLTQLN